MHGKKHLNINIMLIENKNDNHACRSGILNLFLLIPYISLKFYLVLIFTVQKNILDKHLLQMMRIQKIKRLMFAMRMLYTDGNHQVVKYKKE